MKYKNQPTGQRGMCGRTMLRPLFGFVTSVLSLLYACAAEAQFRLCTPSTTWFGTSPPVLDGMISSSTEWRGAFRAELGPTAAPDVFFLGMRDANNLYLFVEANNLNSLNSGNSSNNPYAANLLVLTFDDGGGNFEQIQILPVVDGATVPHNGASGTIQYWSGTRAGTAPISWSIFNPPGPVHHPTWLGSSIVKAGYSSDGAGAFPFHWALEMALPFQSAVSSGLKLPSSGFFKLYMDVFRVVNGDFQQASWPPNNLEAGCPPGTPVIMCNPNAQTPDPSSWGASTIDATQACSLVNLRSISVTNATNAGGALIDVLSPNTFNAQVENNAPPPGTGLPDAAKQVSATFSIWNFGIPSLPQWQAIPTANNPTLPADLPPGPATLSPSSWTVPVSDQPKYDPNLENDPTNPSHPHQCVRVQLSSNDLNTAFTNNPAFQNMNFVHASKFEEKAEVSAEGYPKRPEDSDTVGKNYDQLFDLHVITHQEILKPGQVGNVGRAIVPPVSGHEKERGIITSQLIAIVAGCRHTGYYMTVNNQSLELCDPVGDFGYIIRHAGKAKVEDWGLEFTGAGLEKLRDDKNLYRLRVRQNGVASVTTRAEPTELTRARSSKLAVKPTHRPIIE